MLKNVKFIKFLVVKIQKQKHIRKAQKMSYLIKKKIIQKAYETAILWSKQKMLKLVDFYVFLKIFKLIIDVKTFLNYESSIFVLYEWKKTVSKIKVPAYVLAILNFFPNDQGFLPLLYIGWKWPEKSISGINFGPSRVKTT